MREYSDRLGENIDSLCKASVFIEDWKSKSYMLSGTKLRDYLSLSHSRADVLESEFAKLGYDVEKKNFTYKGQKATNLVFRKGEASKDEIWIVAHHDYYSGLGAEDNATGLSVMLELARHFGHDKLGKNLVFASFDLEEHKLQGSKNYVKKLSGNDFKKIKYMITLECLGSGKDIVICKSVYGARSDAGLVRKLDDTASSLGYKFVMEDFDFFWSDHVPFAERGVKTVEICSINYDAYKKYGGKVSSERKDGSVAHTPRDRPENIDVENLIKVYKTLVNFIEENI